MELIRNENQKNSHFGRWYARRAMTYVVVCAFLTLALLATVSTVAAKSLEITVPNVRSDQGTVLVMATVAGTDKPVYGKADAKQGAVIVVLEGIDADAAEVSLFHDENNNYQMDMGDRGPTEGHATRKCKLAEEKNIAKMNLFYPAAE